MRRIRHQNTAMVIEMKIQITAILVCWTYLFLGVSSAQEFDYAELEKTVQQVVEKVRPATVAVRMDDGDASGVIVSKEGHVLTAGHCVMEPGTKFTIELPDGRVFDGVGMGMEPNLDCGLIKIESEGDWPVVELGWSSELKKNQPCISLGHSHGFQAQRGPVVRFGRIVEPVSDVNGYIQSSCLMEPGDSGGPLFDLNGRLIGIHTQCDESLDDNFEVPVDAFRRYWLQLNEPKKFYSRRVVAGPDFGMTLPTSGGNFGFGGNATSVKVRKVKKDGWAAKQGLEKSDRLKRIDGQRVTNAHQVRMLLYRAFLFKQDNVEVQLSRDGENQTLQVDLTDIEVVGDNQYANYIQDGGDGVQPISELEELPEQFADMESRLDDHCVKVAYEKSGRTRYAQGTVLTLDEQIFVVCKKSLVGEAPKIVTENGAVDAKILLQDSQNDVLLMSLDGNLEGVTPAPLPTSPSAVTLGEFLISPSYRNSGQVSVRGAPWFSAKRNGFLGIVPELVDEQIVLREVVPESAADQAGLQVGDQILTIGETKIKSPMDVRGALKPFMAGDIVQIKTMRDDQELNNEVELGTRDDDEMEMQMHVADFFAGGKSKVRSGFAEVIAHDARIRAKECGGPVFDTDGNLVGVNIARFSRTQCYILPTNVIKSLIEKACKKESAN